METVTAKLYFLTTRKVLVKIKELWFIYECGRGWKSTQSQPVSRWDMEVTLPTKLNMSEMLLHLEAESR